MAAAPIEDTLLRVTQERDDAIAALAAAGGLLVPGSLVAANDIGVYMAERVRVLEAENANLRREVEDARNALEPLEAALAHHRASHRRSIDTVRTLEAIEAPLRAELEVAHAKALVHEERINFLEATLCRAEAARLKADSRAEKARAALLTKERELGGARSLHEETQTRAQLLMHRLVEMELGFGQLLYPKGTRHVPTGAPSSLAAAAEATHMLPRPPPGAPSSMAVASGTAGAREAKEGLADAARTTADDKAAKSRRLPTIPQSSPRQRHAGADAPALAIGGMANGSGSPRRTFQTKTVSQQAPAHDDRTSGLQEKALAVLHDIQVESLQAEVVSLRAALSRALADKPLAPRRAACAQNSVTQPHQAKELPKSGAHGSILVVRHATLKDPLAYGTGSGHGGKHGW